MSRQTKCFIAIDPGAVTGIAIWTGQNLRLKSGNFFEALYFLDEYVFDDLIANKKDFEIIIEDPNKVKLTFRRKQHKQGENTVGMNDRKAQNVGMNKRDAQLWILWCEHNRLKHKAIKPLQKTLNGRNLWGGSNGKISQDEFEEKLGINIKTNQHCRDACLILSQYVKLEV